MREPTETGLVVWVRPERPMEGRRTGPQDWVSPYRDHGLAEYGHAWTLAQLAAAVLRGTVHVVRIYRYRSPTGARVHVVGDVIDLGIDHWIVPMTEREARDLIPSHVADRLESRYNHGTSPRWNRVAARVAGVLEHPCGPSFFTLLEQRVPGIARPRSAGKRSPILHMRDRIVYPRRSVVFSVRIFLVHNAERPPCSLSTGGALGLQRVRNARLY